MKKNFLKFIKVSFIALILCSSLLSLNAFPEDAILIGNIRCKFYKTGVHIWRQRRGSQVLYHINVNKIFCLDSNGDLIALISPKKAVVWEFDVDGNEYQIKGEINKEGIISISHDKGGRDQFLVDTKVAKGILVSLLPVVSRSRKRKKFAVEESYLSSYSGGNRKKILPELHFSFLSSYFDPEDDFDLPNSSNSDLFNELAFWSHDSDGVPQFFDLDEDE